MKNFLLLMFLSGCIQAKNSVTDIPEPADDQVPVVEEVVTPDVGGGVIENITFSAPADTYSLIKGLAAPNTITISKPVHVVQDSATVDISAGSEISYSFSDDKGTVDFKPYPKIQAVLPGTNWKIIPTTLHRLTILPDGSGIASTGIKDIGFWWKKPDLESITAAANLIAGPVLRFHTRENCPPCKRGVKELEEAKKAGKLPFEYEVTDENVDYISTSRPVLTCKSMGKVWTPSCATDDPATGHKRGDMRPGWHGVDDAILWWKQVPKK